MKASIKMGVVIDPKAVKAVQLLAQHFEAASQELYLAADDMDRLILMQMHKDYNRNKSFQYRWNMFKAKILRPYWSFRSKFTPTTCGYACDWTYPYGFVPEADCPVHDK